MAGGTGAHVCSITHRSKSMTRLTHLVKELGVKLVALLISGIASECLAGIVHACLQHNETHTMQIRTVSKDAALNIMHEFGSPFSMPVLISIVIIISLLFISIIMEGKQRKEKQIEMKQNKGRNKILLLIISTIVLQDAEKSNLF